MGTYFHMLIGHLCIFFDKVSAQVFPFLITKIFCLKERVQAGEGQREREGKNLKQPPCPARSLTQGSISPPCDHDLSQNQESDAPPTESLRRLSFSYFWVPIVHLYFEYTDIYQTFRKYLSDVSFTNIFFQSVICLPILLTVFLAQENILTLMKSSWSIISHRDHAFGVVRKFSPCPRPSRFPLCDLPAAL